MIKVYGALQTRAMRTLWMLKELGLEYEHDPVPSSQTRTPEFLKINPNGHVPVLVDGDLKLFESMAINLYLAQKYGQAKGLWPKTIEGQALAYQWSFWVMLETEADLLNTLRHRALLPEDKRDEAAAAKSTERLQGPLKVLDAALQGKEYLAGPGFTVADLNVAAVFSWSRGGKVSLDAFPNVNRWFQASFGRPARKDATAK
ncbi:MAG: glutathione S-transferase family protein [Candidatus Lambdaproteobacteria bacterium]|nr:glutathione S-transferase family protein [Candidatus Lambdaproteobacteria bacterium]